MENETMNQTTTTLTTQDQSCAADFRRVRPTKADQRNGYSLEMWRDDIEHSIRCRELDETRAAAFRAAVGLDAL